MTDGAAGGVDARGVDSGGTPQDATSGGGIGNPCANNDSRCPGGLCNFKLGTCQNPEPMNGPCIRDFECLAGLCSYVTDTCRAPAPDNYPCQRDVECAGGLCNEALAVCAPPQGFGGSCIRNIECASGFCSGGSC
jgi:hypothetical protein